jgi:hypothetical protein
MGCRITPVLFNWFGGRLDRHDEDILDGRRNIKDKKIRFLKLCHIHKSKISVKNEIVSTELF